LRWPDKTGLEGPK